MYKGPMVSKETKENSCKIMFWFFFPLNENPYVPRVH